MKVRGVDHVSVTTSDIERSLAFYRDLLGLTVTDRDELHDPELALVTGVPGAKARYAELDLGDGRVMELLEYLSPGAPLSQSVNSPGSGHLAFTVDDIDAFHARFVQAGVTVRSTPVTIREPGPWFGVRVIYSVDPDGVTIELVERPPARTDPSEARDLLVVPEAERSPVESVRPRR